jgi:4-carboxymuconolactone decarboxylase
VPEAPSTPQVPGSPPVHLYAALGHSETVMRAFSQFGMMLIEADLPPRSREIVILRVGWNCAAEYEFGHHVLRARAAGLEDDELVVLAGGDPKGWSEEDRALVAMADELCADDCVSEETWSALARRWAPAQLVELLVIAGFYRMIAGFLNSTGVQPEDGVPGWPTGVTP